MNQNGKEGFRTRKSFTNSCLGKIAVLGAIVAGLLIVAHLTVPDRESMILETEDNIRQCIQANDSLQTDKIDDAINNIGYTFTHADSTFDAEVWEAFNKYNRLEYHKHSFYATVHVRNNFRPQGTRVGVGIFGLIIPTVNFNDILLRVDPIHKGYGKELIQNTNDNGEEDLFGENPNVKVYHYKDDEEQ